MSFLTALPRRRGIILAALLGLSATVHTQSFPTKPIKILVIVAHPDDIEFGVGGSVAAWTAAGHEVTYVIVTDGSAGSNAKDVDLGALVRQRELEQLEAAGIVGVHDVRFLGYKDGELQPDIELRRDLTRIIREVQPYRVVIMDPTAVMISMESSDYINHPDHRAVGEASLYAIFPSAETRPIFPELLDEGLEPHHPETFAKRYAHFLASALVPPAHHVSNFCAHLRAMRQQRLDLLVPHRGHIDGDVRLVAHHQVEFVDVMRF